MNKTQTYYNDHHQELIERYNSADLSSLHELFKRHITPTESVLEIGFGSGRDLRYIHSLGAECWGVDSTKGFVDALQKDENFKGKVFHDALPILKTKFKEKFDIVVCIAVIMHLTREDIKIWIDDIKNYLAEGGKVIVSYSLNPREDKERFFEDLRESVVEQMFLDAGFELVEEIFDDDDGLSRGIGWVSGVYRL